MASEITTTTLPVVCDYLAPDGSEIRLLAAMDRGGLCHCLLPPGATSVAVRHRSVEEIWYCIQGSGQLWRESEVDTQVVQLAPHMALTIPPHVAFQFRNTGSEPLCLVIVTMPPWPGAQEAELVAGRW
jgi:mannose-6-phosphate isomerase-like protein (cupin superfamily)